ncbi:LacI family DNA-binding transcriptional regulator [Paenibacillus beijingensis]|uniref:LacI family transcriptional regulator n=1 Tax=Paenibacillus beijingensis TaxID=1126833 RepID=A0A0D5NE49_9BACL|nr:substrate-binding domain-containing protein [Paenibacillus beijingensis]AJY73440.1 LacI family transcriptional regulator [Paenibacillus beijingensis]
MNPTIRDVAKRANVSVATVSRILNNLTGYSDKTKQKVLQTIEEMGYQPNAIARSLNNKRTQTIGVLFPLVSSEFSSEILYGIENYAHDNNYSVLVCNTEIDGTRTLKYLQLLREKQIDGVIFASETLKDEYYSALQSAQIPVVLVASQSERPDVPYVKVDDKQAAYDATRYLIERGHRDIAMISGTKGDPIAGTTRFEGYLLALHDHGIEYDDELVRYGDFLYESGCEAMKSLLQIKRPLTAVFAASDEMAIGAITEASRHGMRVPDDISIIGYDNLRLSSMLIPALTTVHQPLNEMGRIAAEKLITMVETGEAVPSSIVPHAIMERQTVKNVI